MDPLSTTTDAAQIPDARDDMTSPALPSPAPAPSPAPDTDSEFQSARATERIRRSSSAPQAQYNPQTSGGGGQTREGNQPQRHPGDRDHRHNGRRSRNQRGRGRQRQQNGPRGGGGRRRRPGRTRRRRQSRHRAHQSLRSFPMERQRAGSIRSAKAASFAAPRTAIWPSRATRTCRRRSCGSTCCAAATRFSPRPDTITAVASSSSRSQQINGADPERSSAPSRFRLAHRVVSGAEAQARDGPSGQGRPRAHAPRDRSHRADRLRPARADRRSGARRKNDAAAGDRRRRRDQSSRRRLSSFCSSTSVPKKSAR